MRTVLGMIVITFSVGVCFSAENGNYANEKNVIVSWARTALLGQPVSDSKSAGASISTDFPVTFDLLTPKVSKSNLASLRVLRQDYAKLNLGKSVVDTPLQLGSKAYMHGLGTHSVSNILVLLDKPANLFTADIGVNADTKVGTVIFVIEMGGKELYRSGVCKGGDMPISVSIDLKGATEFNLQVIDDGNGPSCDWADWCNAKVLYADGTSQWLDELAVDASHDEDYIKTPSTDLLPKWKKTHIVDKSQDYAEIHNIIYEDPNTGIKVSCDIKVFKDYPAVEWVARFTNTSSKETPIIDHILPLNSKITVPDEKAVLHYAQGSINNNYANSSTLTGYDFQPYEMQIKPNSSNSFDPEAQSSTRWLPFYNMQWSGGGLIWAIGWSGRWQMDFTRDAGNNITLKAGQRTLRTTLFPGESIRTPRMLLLSWQGDDRMRGHNQWRQLLISHYLPRYEGKLQMTPVAAMTHLWTDGGGPKMNETTSLACINKQTEFGGEVFWMDAGWYCKGSWTEAFGTWDPEKTKFPNGMKCISDAAHAQGMKFLLWFVEQTVSPNSYIQKTKPQWVYSGTFDVSNPDARKWLTDYISKRIADFGVDIYRHDGGFTYLAVHDTPERQGITENHGIEGWYAHWDELVKRHPGLVIDNCAGGGQNIDLEMTMRSLPLWQSDVECSCPTDIACPSQLTMGQVQNAGLSLYVPLHATGVWGMDANPYWFRSVATTGVVFTENITDPNFNMTQAKKNVEELKSLRELWLGDYYPLTDINLEETKWCGWEFYRPDLQKGFAMLFKRYLCKQEEFPVKIRGLDKNAKYKVTFVDEKKTRVMKAKELENLTVRIKSTGSKTMSASEAGVLLSANQKNNGVLLRPMDGETQNAPVIADGREAWRSVKQGSEWMMYFVVSNPTFQSGHAPKVKLACDYFDEGRGEIRIVYDSTDKSVQVVSNRPGAWKEAGKVVLTNTKKWKTFEYNITDAFFNAQCNGADIRLEISGTAAPAIASLKLTNLGPNAQDITTFKPRSALILFEKL